MRTSRIDRALSSLQGWQMAALRVEPRATQDPIRWHFSGWSDHSPVTACVGIRRHGDPGSRPISALILKQPEFLRRLALLEAAADLEGLWPLESLETHTTLMREAAKTAGRNIAFGDDNNTLATEFCKFAHIARAVAGNQIKRPSPRTCALYMTITISPAVHPPDN